MSHTTTLTTHQQASQVLASAGEWIAKRLSAGRRVRLTLAEEKRTPPQNDAIQALVRSIGKQAGYADHDRLRALLCEQWRHETKRPAAYAPSLDGLRMVDISNRTSALDVADAAEFLAWLEAWEASHA